MRTTSEAYEPFSRVRMVDALVSFEVIPKALVKSQIAATAPAAKVGRIADTLNGEPEILKKYATVERDGWPLDASCVIMPDYGAETGFWSQAVTDANGDFDTPLVVRMDVGSPIDSFGWTFHFDAPTGVWASRVKAEWFDGETSLGVVEGYPDGPGSESYGWSLQQFATEYTAVEFTFYGTNLPLRMLRLAEIDFGISRHFSMNTITEMSIQYGLTPDSSAFPSKELTFVFDNSKGEFNVLSPAGVYQYWRNGQVLTVRLRVNGETVNMGMFRESETEIGANRLLVKVRSHDECYRLARQKYYPGTMASEASVTLQVAVEHVLRGYDMRVDYGGLENETVSLVVSDNHAKRTMLRYLAQAARASVWIDRDGVLRFRRFVSPAAEDAVAEITADELYNWSGVSIVAESAGCVLSVTREYGEGHDPETETEVYTAGTPDDAGADTIYVENPCVAATNGEAVAEWLLAAANWRKRYEVKNRCDPAVEIGDPIIIEDAFHNNDPAIVTGIDIKYNGALYATTSAARSF